MRRRTGRLRVAAFASAATTGMVPMRPTTSVAPRIRSRVRVRPARWECALARSIRCGKSMFQGCGGVGTLGHVAEIAEITLLHDLWIVRLIDPIDL